MNAKNTILATLFAAAFVAPLSVAPVQAQIQAQATRNYTQAELDQMLAPIALYPDALLSQILMASTYPIEVVEAARWTRANPGLKGDAAVRAVQNEDWDPSVKSLVAFPQILQRMDEQLSWTQSLGDAFLDQETQLMDTVQQLRRRAQAAGNLQSSEQIHVQQQGPTILIEPASPQYVYVPYYDPQVVYGTWWWPAYRPVYWAPWPGYARPYRPGYTAGFWWGTPVGLSVNFFFGNVDWRQRHVHVVHPRAYYYRPPVYINRTVVVDRGRWQHDPHHRRGVDYRAAEVQQRNRSEAASVERARQQREQAQAAERAQRDQSHQKAEAVRVQQQQRQQAEAARFQQQQQQQRQQAEVSRAQQRQQADAARFQQQQQRQQAEVSRAQQRQQVEAERFQQQQQRQQAEASRAQQQQQREQAQAAERARHDQQRQRAEAARAQQQQQRQEQRAAMPAAKAPQTPRAERQEQRQERGQKG